MDAEVREYGDEERAFYGERLEEMTAVMDRLLDYIRAIREEIRTNEDRDPVEHVKARIKTAESMKAKLTLRGFPSDVKSAFTNMTDYIGIRIVTTFVSDVYMMAKKLAEMPGCEAVLEKDYIKSPKANGYRSYHLILMEIDTGLFAEVQVRTIAMDCWASLEHQLKYKKNIRRQELLVKELKRCADEIASTDLSLETIRDMINMEE